MQLLNTGNSDLNVTIEGTAHTVKPQWYINVDGGAAIELNGTKFGPFGSNAIVFSYEENNALAGASPQ